MRIIGRKRNNMNNNEVRISFFVKSGIWLRDLDLSISNAFYCKACYKPSDLWSQEDDLLFLKWVTNKRDICYHMMSRDTSCRIHEQLALKIKDIVFKWVDNVSTQKL